MLDNKRPFSIGYAKDRKDGRPLYYAFAAKTEKDLLKINKRVSQGMTLHPDDFDFVSLTDFFVIDTNVQTAAKIIEKELEKRGWVSQVNPLHFWQSKCPWLLN